MDPTTAATALAGLLTLQAAWMLTRRPNLDHLLRLVFWIVVTAFAWTRIQTLALVAAALLAVRLGRIGWRRARAPSGGAAPDDPPEAP